MKFKDIKLPLGLILLLGFLLFFIVFVHDEMFLITLGMIMAIALALILGLPIRKKVIEQEQREKYRRYVKELKEKYKGL